MLLRLDPASPVPAFRQVVEQVKRALAEGTLRPGDRLPTIREAAVTLRLNRNTVARAYEELDREGLVGTRPGQGTTVLEAASGLTLTERRRRLVAGLDTLLAQARLDGLDRARVEGVFAQRLAVFFPEPETGAKAGGDENSENGDAPSRTGGNR